jgi:predicted ester cyclase
VLVTTADSNKQLVQRLVDEAINGRDLESLDEFCSPQLAPKLRRAFTHFASAFPDWRQEVVQLVAEDDVVVARFRCRGTHLGEWQGLAATGRTMDIDEVYFFQLTDGRVIGLWGLEDTWTRLEQLRGAETRPGELGSLS